ncbi:IS4 family transposase, partial [Microcoleus sp. AR_TQ3_B6]
GKSVKKMGVQKYVARPKQPKHIYRSHSTFQVGMRAENWVSFIDICQKEVRKYISLYPNKRSNYQRGKSAAKLIRTVVL